MFVIGFPLVMSCAPPPISELLPKEGVNCKAEIRMSPDELEGLVHIVKERPEGEVVSVSVRIYECQ